MIAERDTVCLPTTSPNVCIFSSYNEKYAPLAAIARPNWKAYAERHGYGLRFYPNAFHLDSARPETFGDKNKFELYYDLRGHVDIVMFLDIDALFMNHDVEVTDWIEHAPMGRRAPSEMTTALRRGSASPAPFFWTYDENGPLSGLWIARTDDTTERHLRYAYSYAARENNVRNGKIEPNGISDQDAMTRLMHVPPFSETFDHCYPAADVGHCYPENYEPGKWLITFPGLTLDEKREGMLKYAELAGR